MFQYAAGRSLAIKSNSAFGLDRRFFDDGVMEFELGHFNIHDSLEPAQLPPLRSDNPLRHMLWRRLRLSPQLVEEGSLAFDGPIRGLKKNVYLDGFWQSERYFLDIAETIREDFRILTPPTPENSRHLDDIFSVPAVSLHVRRGNYLLLKHHGTCSLEYYAKAIDLVASGMTAEPVVYVFSDDPEWARDNLVLPFEKRVMAHNNSASSYEDLRLMSACRHHIIANSTFSWWGAWLSPSPDKIVVAPQRWFADPNIDNPNIIPAGWHRVSG